MAIVILQTDPHIIVYSPPCNSGGVSLHQKDPFVKSLNSGRINSEGVNSLNHVIKGGIL